MSYAFIGSYFLSPYLSRFGEALNLAAVNVETSRPERPTTQDPADPNPDLDAVQAKTGAAADSGVRPPAPYQLIRSANVGMTAIVLFARRPAAIHHIQAAECGFGVADMGNKGAAGLRVTYADEGLSSTSPGGQRTTELTFVATHLAPMEWNLKRRNANWRSIAGGLTFRNPKDVVEGLGPGPGLAGRLRDSAASAPRSPEEDAEDEGSREWLLRRGEEDLAEHHDTLRDISIFRPTSHLFVAGDLNYRIASKTPPPLASFPSLRDGPDHWSAFLERDQLTRERLAGRTLHGLSEAPIAFPPTYKYELVEGDDAAADRDGTDGDLDWKWAAHRWPSWTDRVLYLAVPGWARRRRGAPDLDVAVRAYGSLPLMRSSDHQGVYFRAAVPLLGAADLAAPGDEGADGGAALQGDEADDPRVRLPVPIDVDAWGRRAAARRREIMAGWSMFLWSTREGAVLIGTVLLTGVASWWLWQSFFLV